MESFCRGCLNQYNEPSELLQYTEKNRRLFVYSTGIQVKRNDIFTFQLCNDCFFNMKLGCKFKKLCRNSDKKFRTYLTLKEAGEVIDFNTFLKNNDDSLLFRLPLPGSGTPNINKVKDEDNVSTCTSIQNFISDIMESEEIPATEARIIQEVIEEEADVSEDSLDSHWLQDDSFETDFKLDFSFSPFATPNYVNDDHRYAPKKHNDDPQTIAPKIEISDDSIHEFVHKNLSNVDDSTQVCTIDRNLENALQDETNENFYLNDLLVTPPLYTNSPPTPLITKILFGDKLDSDSPPRPPAQLAENFVTVKSETNLLDEFFANTEDIQADQQSEFVDESNVTEQNRTERETREQERKATVSLEHTKYSITNFYCKMCRKKFKNLAALKVHCSRLHKLKIKHKVPYVRKVRICDNCGKSYHNLAEFVAHVQSHNTPLAALVCKFCTLKFSSEAKLRMHMTTHVGKFKANSPKKKYVCNVCGLGSSSAANLKTHQMRHSKSYTIHCEECGRGFYRRSDLTTHMRHHTGEKPFSCIYCERSFARRDVLNRHMKCHTDERPYECQYCNTRYAKKQELKTHIEKGKTCREKRLKLAAEELKRQPTHGVSVFYGPVNGTDIKLANLQNELI